MTNRRITAKDVAAQAGVSRTTVSYVLNNVEAANISEETRQRVLSVAEELGYVPDAAAQALASGRTQTIGLMLPSSQPHPRASTSHYRIIEGLLEIVQQFGVRLLVDSVQKTQNSDTYLNLARNKRIDGIILSDLRVDDEALSKLVNDTFPIVLLGRLPGVKVSSVEFDNRGRGYRDSLAAHRITFDEKLVRYGDYSAESGYAAAMSLLGSGAAPTALFVTSDEVALGVLAALHKRGVSVPDDIAVVGFDDNPLAQYTIPALTTVRLPFEEMGRLAGKMLLDLIFHNSKPGRQVLLETELIVRDSSVPSKQST